MTVTHAQRVQVCGGQFELFQSVGDCPGPYCETCGMCVYHDGVFRSCSREGGGHHVLEEDL